MKVAKKNVLLLMILFISHWLLASEEELAPAKNLEELKSQIELLMKKHDIPGAGIAIVDKKQDRWVTGLGLASKEPEKPASAETLFRIGSISKMFVSLAALKLQQEGRLDIQTPLKEIAPEIAFENPWESTHPVRLVHLLEHTAGWDDIHLTEYANNDPTPLTLKQGLDFHPHSRTSRWRPGDRMSYSNSGPPAVAYAIEKITGEHFEDYVKRELFDPLDMATASYRYPEDEFLMATLYEQGKAAKYWHIIMRPSGAINASARDMARLVRFFIERGNANGEVILSETLLRRMERPESSLAAKAGMTSGYGLSNYTSYHQRFVFHGHDGGINGGLAQLAYLPKEGLGYALMINSDNGAGFRAIGQAIRSYLTFGLPVPKAPQTKTRITAQQQEYEGYYTPVNPRQQLAFFIDFIFGDAYFTFGHERVSISNQEEHDYLPVNDVLFVRDDRSVPTLVLLTDDSGKAIQVDNQYYQKTNAFNHWLKLTLAWLFLSLVLLQLIWFWVWLVRRLSNKIESGPAMQIRLWPFFAALMLVISVALMIYGQVNDVFILLGTPTPVSIGIMLGTYAFAICSIVSLVQNIRFWKTTLNPWAKGFCLLSSVIFVIATLYLANFGVIGLQTFG
jgi:CubicO group peptidase (beta-lactamase class C family)